jgi:hypothetical protein
VNGIRVDERDLESEHAAPGRLIDQFRAGVRKTCESRADVRDLVRDVMHPGAAVREEAADGGVVLERPEELEPTLPDANRRRLDPLLLDARALLEPGAEQALIRLECTVEILDCKADMVDGEGRLHLAIVCERLAATMRVTALALVLTAALLAGCGGSKKEEAKPNGEASKPPNRVLADAKSAATSASSAHVSGSLVSNGTPFTIDLSMVRGKGATGSVSINGLQFELVKVGDTAYIKGSDAFYQHFAGPVAQLLHGKWVKSSTTSGRFRSFAALTSMTGLFAKISSSHGKLVNDGTKTYQGQQVVVIRDTSDNSKLYVAATGKPYPVALSGGNEKRSGRITFDDWNEPVSLKAPENAIDISQFGG